MATAPFICDVEGSKESLRPAVSSQQLRHRVCSYTLLQVLLGVLVVLVLALTGGIIWMKLSQDCPAKFWTVRFTGLNAIFTSPRTQEYSIIGHIFTKEQDNNCKNTFRLVQWKQQNGKESEVIVYMNVTETFFKDVKLWEGATLSLKLNCNLTIDEEKSKLFIYQHNS